MREILIFFIKCYQLILSPWIGQHCRFYPTCSNYGLIALQRFGTIKGCYLILKRIIRCNPFCSGGVDHVPEKLGKCDG